jgi:tetratricopeptide (TPR) repeat protein
LAADLLFVHDLRSAIKMVMKPIIKIVSVLAVILLVTALFFWLRRDAGYYYRKASVKLTNGDYSGALNDYNKAIQLKPDYVDAFVGRGETKYKKGDPDGALADYNKAAELKPDLVPTPDLARTPEAIVTNEIAKQAVALFESKNYDKLDELAAKLRSSKECYADGVWKLASVYDGLVPSNHASDEDWDARLLAIGNWAMARPDAITARVAWANLLVAYAWKARGSGEVDTVSKTGWRLFGQRLIEAARILKDANALKEQCPIYWRVLMTDALGLQFDKTRFNAIFDEAIKAEPDCEGYYYRRAIYLLPQWYGSEGEWQTDLTKSADQVGGEKGDMLYAQVVWNMHRRYDMDPFLDKNLENNLSWARLDRGFGLIGKKFPAVLAVKIEQAQLAALFNDTQVMVLNHNGTVKDGKVDFAGAINDYNKAIAINPNYAKAYGNRGNAKSRKGDLDGALADLNRAIEIQPDYVIAFYNRASAKRAKGDMAGAMADFNKTIQLQPNFAAGYAGRAGLKQANGDYDGAIADFTKAIDLTTKTTDQKPDFVRGLYIARGNLRQYKGDKDGAAADFNQAAKFPKAGK